jgi:pimeloyl-ACP methyl ester carboxylesterase
VPGVDRILFVHGLWMPGSESGWFRRRLAARLGFATDVFRYPTVREPLDAVVDRLERVVAERAGEERLHLVGHSLGGVVLMRLMERIDAGRRPDGRVLLLGSPVCGSAAARSASRFGFARPMLGPIVAQELLCDRPRRWSPPNELGIIAGARPLGLGRLFARFDEANDGTVAVRETCVDGATDRIVLPVSHLGMLISGRVVEECACFLRDGRFSLQGASAQATAG